MKSKSVLNFGLRLALLAAVGVTAASCAAGGWVRKDATAETYETDIGECRVAGFVAATGDVSVSAVAAAVESGITLLPMTGISLWLDTRAEIRKCMAERGYGPQVELAADDPAMTYFPIVPAPEAQP